METGAAPIAEWSNAVTGYLSTNLMATGRMNMLGSGMETGAATMAGWSNAVIGYIEWLFINQPNCNTSDEYAGVRYGNRGCHHG